jgi:uncharacterized delta-60 repeat protein
MRGYGMVGRRRARVVIVVTLAVIGVLVAFTSSAAADPPAAASKRIGPSVFKWSVSRIEQGVGKKLLGHDDPPEGDVFDLGPSAFELGNSRQVGVAQGTVDINVPDHFSSVRADAPVLNPSSLHSAKGGVAHLDEYATYEKERSPGGSSLQITIDDIHFKTADTNGAPKPSECSKLSVSACHPIQAVVHYHARAYPVPEVPDPSNKLDSSTKPQVTPFFNVGGVAYLEGYQNHWFVGAATTADSRAPFWTDAEFIGRGTSADGTFTVIRLNDPLTLNVPLGSVLFHQRFTVHVTMEAEAIDDRGGESGATADIVDPQHAGPGLIARGLEARGARKFKEPPMQPLPAARCPAGPSLHTGTVQLRDPAFSAGEASGTALVLVTRKGGSRGATSVMVSTSGGAAQPGADFKPTRTLVRFENGDTSPRLVEIPIREDLAAESPEDFKVSLAHVRCSTLGKQRSASVTILDDDQPPPPPPPTFTIGGSVDGLQGSGLVLSNLGAPVSVSANGSVTFPGTAVTGQSYEVNVTTQPTSPDQICTVDHGTGQVGVANVTDIAVHCVTQVPPSGLDSSFGAVGRVVTPGNGEGRAVLIQPDGKIVTVGPREVGQNFHFDFGATRHDSAGDLDPNFGAGGIATTDLGGNDDKAFDAALLPGGGFVAVGQADPAGLANTDFGVVRYTPDGHPDPAFNTTGIETTDLTGRDDVAHAVAVQPDGKIVAAGTAETSPGGFDFALVRYNADGTLDRTFGANGIVTADLGTFDDVANAIALQPDGKIVAVGDSGENIALARYRPDGSLDPTFGGAGTVVSDLGFDDVANGAAITSGGTIPIAGTRLGPSVNLDAMVASYGPNVKLNLGFGDFGVAEADLSGGDDFGDDLVLKPDGDIVVVGSATSAASPPLTDMALVRYRPDGTVAASLTTDFNGTGDFGHALAIDFKGAVVAARSSGDQFALMRANL